MKAKTTSFDIAYRAGVSQSTVSRALRDSSLVNLDTRKRIQAIAKEMHYTVDKNASNLRSQHSDTLAVLLFEDPTSDDSQINPFFLSMIGSITRACSKFGYDLLISFQQASNDWHADFEDSRKADGIILLGYGDYLDYTSRLDKLIEHPLRALGAGIGRSARHFNRLRQPAGWPRTNRTFVAARPSEYCIPGPCLKSLPRILRPLSWLCSRFAAGRHYSVAGATD